MTLDGMGLVCTGSVNQSFLARMPALLARLGPIKASSFRVSRQVSNTLRAGQAASHYSALEPCPMVWFAVPETGLDRAARDFTAQTPNHKTMVVLCDCARDSATPGPLRAAGARIASLNPVPGFRERLFVTEGHRDTVRAVRRLLGQDHRKLIELKAGGKPMFLAGIRCAAPLLLPWIAGGIQSLRAAGFTRAEAADVCEHLGMHALRSYSRAGPKAWNHKITASLRHALEHEIEAIRSRNPELAELYEQGIRIAIKQF
jgi:hypothetical protein